MIYRTIIINSRLSMSLRILLSYILAQHATTDLRNTQLLICETHNYWFALHATTDLRNKQRRTCATHNYGLAQQAMTDLRNTQWRICAIRNYGLTQHILLPVMAAIADQKKSFFLIFRGVRQECVSIRGSVGLFSHLSVHPSIRPSVRRSVQYACAKTVFSGCFWPQWDPILNQMLNKRVMRASFATLSFHLSFRSSVSPYM